MSGFAGSGGIDKGCFGDCGGVTDSSILDGSKGGMLKKFDMLGVYVGVLGDRMSSSASELRWDTSKSKYRSFIFVSTVRSKDPRSQPKVRHRRKWQ